jgi:hypothetical protein
MRYIPYAVAAALALLAAACLPVTSKVPVGTSVGFKVDPALLGTWKATGPDGGEPAYIHILGADDGTMTAILVTPPQKENLGDWSVYRLRVAALGTNHIVNAQETIANDKPSEGPLAQLNVLLLYRASGPGKIVLYQMDDKAAADAIRAGEIAGDIEPGDNGDVHITASEPALDAFMKTPRAAKLFSKALVTLIRAG